MTKDEALKLALELLESAHVATDLVWKRHDAVEAIKEALALPEQEYYAVNAVHKGEQCYVKAQPEPWEKFCDSNCVWTDHHPDCKLAQTEQEPVAWMFQHEETGRMMFVDAQQLEWGFEKGNSRLKKIRPVYTTPPQRTWVGLTADEMRSLLHLATYMDVTDHIHMLMMAEDKLKEKNT